MPARTALLRASFLTLALAFLAGSANTARAQIVVFWFGGTGNWSGGPLTNWGGSLPLLTNQVSVQSGSLTVNISPTISGLTADGSTVTISNNQTITTTGNSTFGTSNVTNVNLSSTSSATKFVVGVSLSVGAAGNINLSNSTENIITGSGSTSQLTNQGTIVGGGQLGAGTLKIINSGTITANQTAALTLDPNAAGLTNTGTLRAISGGTLILKDTQFGGYLNTGGTINAQASSVVHLDTLDLTGGSIATTGSGTIRLTNAFLSNVSISNASGNVTAVSGSSSISGSYTGGAGSQLRIENGAAIEFAGGSSLPLSGGSVNLVSNNSDTTLRFENGATTVSGTGTITLAGLASAIKGSSSSVSFGPNITVQGEGTIDGRFLAITNQGLISSNVSTSELRVDLSASSLTNAGILRATNGGHLSIFGGAVSNSGGLLHADHNASVGLLDTTILGGTLTSTGSGYFVVTDSSSGSAFSNVTVTGGTLVEIADNNRLTLNGTITNNGLIQLSGFSNATHLALSSGTTTLTGIGAVGLIDQNFNFIGGSGTLINDTSHEIYGEGQIGGGSLTIDNRGTINANTNGGTLTLAPNVIGTGLTNSGSLEANNGGVLHLQNSLFVNSGGATINANSGSTISLGNATIQGGTLGGNISVTSLATLRTLQLSPTAIVQVANNTALTLSGAISGSGMIQLNAAGAGTANLIVDPSGATLTGLAVELGNHANNIISGPTPTTSLVNLGFIYGGGNIGNGSLSLTNTGLISATTSTPLTINVTNSGGFNNTGSLHASTGNMVVAHSFTNSGAILVSPSRTFTVNGTLTHSVGAVSLDSGTLALSGSLQTAASTLLTGSGTISGPVTANGFVAPGSSGSSIGTGSLAFNSTLNLGANSYLLLDLASPTAFDTISAQSLNIASGATLGILFTGGYNTTILPTQSFTLISTTGGITGTFANINAGRVFTFDGSGSFAATIAGNTLVISNFQVIPEPSTYALMTLGSAALVVAELRRRRRRS